MQEVYLYGCELCGSVIYNSIDKDNIYYTGCQGCNGHEYHRKIEIKGVYTGMNHFQRNGFFIEEKKDDSKEEDTRI